MDFRLANEGNVYSFYYKYVDDNNNDIIIISKEFTAVSKDSFD
jgi:hypothetical protein